RGVEPAARDLVEHPDRCAVQDDEERGDRDDHCGSDAMRPVTVAGLPKHRLGQRRRTQLFAPKPTTRRPSQARMPIPARLSAFTGREGSRLLIAPSRTSAPAPMSAALIKLVESAGSMMAQGGW